MIRTVLLSATLAIFGTLPAPLLALCNGPSLLDSLPAADRAAITARADQTPFARGTLWQASRGDTQLTIVGTLHLPDPRHGDRLIDLLPAFETADLLLVEATKADQRDMQIHLASDPALMTITDGPSLRDLLDDTTWAAVAEAAAARQVPGFLAAKMQPWFLAMTLSMPPCATEDLVRGDLGLDTLLMEMADGYGVPVAPLEPWQDMLALLSAGTFEEQLDALRFALIAPDDQDALTVAMTDLYFAEETALIWQLTTVTQTLLPDMDPAHFEAQLAQLEQELLVNRNAAWIPVIEEAAQTHDHIILAFGAAHLIDDTGVLALLEQNGWTLTRQ